MVVGRRRRGGGGGLRCLLPSRAHPPPAVPLDVLGDVAALLHVVLQEAVQQARLRRRSHHLHRRIARPLADLFRSQGSASPQVISLFSCFLRFMSAVSGLRFQLAFQLTFISAVCLAFQLTRPFHPSLHIFDSRIPCCKQT